MNKSAQQKRTTLWIILIIIVILLIVGVGFLFSNLSKSQEDKCTEQILSCFKVCSDSNNYAGCILSCNMDASKSIECNSFVGQGSDSFKEQRFVNKLSWQNKRKMNCITDCIDKYQPEYMKDCINGCF